MIFEQNNPATLDLWKRIQNSSQLFRPCASKGNLMNKTENSKRIAHSTLCTQVVMLERCSVGSGELGSLPAYHSIAWLATNRFESLVRRPNSKNISNALTGPLNVDGAWRPSVGALICRYRPGRLSKLPKVVFIRHNGWHTFVFVLH